MIRKQNYINEFKKINRAKENVKDGKEMDRILNQAVMMLCVVLMVIVSSSVVVYAEHKDKIGFELSPIALETRSEPIEQLSDDHFQLNTEFTRVDFMFDDLRGSEHLAYNTSVYSGRFLENSGFTENYVYEGTEIYEYPTHIYTFERAELGHAPGLKSNFVYIEVETDLQMLLSLHVASDKPVDAEYWINRLVMKEPQDTIDEPKGENQVVVNGNITLPEADSNRYFTNDDPSFTHEKTMASYNDIFADGNFSDKSSENESLTSADSEGLLESHSDITWGIFDPSTHYELTYVEDIENTTGINLDIILEYYDLGYLPRVDKMKEISDSGRILELTYQISEYGTFNADALYEVLDGQHDDTINDLIQRIKELDEPVLFRPNNEMNGDWGCYNAMYTRKDAEVYTAFWRWLHDRFETEGVENVIWVWNPNWGDFPNAQWNSYLNYFPGEEYVDVVGLTGYNTGTYYEAETWRSFSEIYNPMIDEYNAHFENFPYMITEFGSSSTGGNKGMWIQTVFNEIENLDIKAAVWWNHVDYDTQMGVVSREYKFDEDPDLMHIFRMNFETE